MKCEQQPSSVLNLSISSSEKNYTGARGKLAPEMPKRTPESQKEPKKICIEFNAKQIKECYFHPSKVEK